MFEALFRGRPLTADELDHVRHNLPEVMYRLALGALTLDAYTEAARAIEAETTARKVQREAVEAARIARESDPEYIALMQSQALYRKYGVSLNDNSLAPRMTNLLQQIDVGNRLPKEDLKWLGTASQEALHTAIEGDLPPTRSRLSCRRIWTHSRSLACYQRQWALQKVQSIKSGARPARRPSVRSSTPPEGQVRRSDHTGRGHA